MANYKKLFDLMDSLIELLDEIIKLENLKLDAIAVNDVKKLENFMKDEQVLTLRLKGMDSKREAAQQELGFDGMSLGQIVEKLESPYREELAQKEEHLHTQVQEVQTATACTNKFIQLHLQSLDMLLEQLEEPYKNEQYDNAGEKRKDDAPTKFTPKKI